MIGSAAKDPPQWRDLVLPS